MLKLRYSRYTAKIAIRWKLVSEEKDRLGKIVLIIAIIVAMEKKRQLKNTI